MAITKKTAGAAADNSVVRAGIDWSIKLIGVAFLFLGHSHWPSPYAKRIDSQVLAIASGLGPKRQFDPPVLVDVCRGENSLKQCLRLAYLQRLEVFQE